MQAKSPEIVMKFGRRSRVRANGQGHHAGNLPQVTAENDYFLWWEYLPYLDNRISEKPGRQTVCWWIC